MSETLYDGRRVRLLTVIDEGNWEGLEIAMGLSVPSQRVVRVLNELVAVHGCPATLWTACYEQVVKALGAVGSSNRGTDTGSGSVEPAHRASSRLIPEERRVPSGSTSSCLRRIVGAELRHDRGAPPGLARVQADVQRALDAGEVRLPKPRAGATRPRRAGRGRVDANTVKPLSKNPEAVHQPVNARHRPASRPGTGPREPREGLVLDHRLHFKPSRSQCGADLALVVLVETHVCVATLVLNCEPVLLP